MHNHRRHYLLEVVQSGRSLLRIASHHEVNGLVGLVQPCTIPGRYRLTEAGERKLASGRTAIERAALEEVLNTP
jgi:hypothetical protein